MFIATANSLDTIHPALLDRMEVIEISGYSIDEKVEIAKKYIIPRQVKDNGITEQVILFKEKQIKSIITDYTFESGVRSLERSIGSVCRAVAYKFVISEQPESFKQIVVDTTLIQDALGNASADTLLQERIQAPGTAIGLAYTSNGGRALLIETTKYGGSGKLVLTGQLGDVMKESVGTALSWIRSNAAKLGLVPSLMPLK